MTNDIIKYKLSDDRKVLKVAIPKGEGTHYVTLGWDHPCTKDELDLALSMGPDLASDGLSQIGQHQTFKRIPTRIGIFYLDMVTGPPTWWLPHFSVFRWGSRLGWLRLGFHLSWRKSDE